MNNGAVISGGMILATLAMTLVPFQVAAQDVEGAYVKEAKELLAIHENPELSIGKTIVVSSRIAWLSGSLFTRSKETNGYLFSWYLGEGQDNHDRIGQSFLSPSALNYWCATDVGLDAKKLLESGLVYRAALMFEIKQVKFVGRFGTEETHIVAELKKIFTPKQEAEIVAKANASSKAAKPEKKPKPSAPPAPTKPVDQEQRAVARLKLAKLHLEGNDKSAAIETLELLLREGPKTAVADEAKKLLNKLKKENGR